MARHQRSVGFRLIHVLFKSQLAAYVVTLMIFEELFYSLNSQVRGRKSLVVFGADNCGVCEDVLLIVDNHAL